jgi:hypothetical protein
MCNKSSLKQNTSIADQIITGRMKDFGRVGKDIKAERLKIYELSCENYN